MQFALYTSFILFFFSLLIEKTSQKVSFPKKDLTKVFFYYYIFLRGNKYILKPEVT